MEMLSHQQGYLAEIVSLKWEWKAFGMGCTLEMIIKKIKYLIVKGL
jgi:hypothetical protein